MLKAIITIVASTIQNLTLKLFCLSAIIVPFIAFLYGFCFIVKHGLLFMLFTAAMWIASPFFILRTDLIKTNE